MAANLKSLIRVRKHAIEQKQKFLAELYRQAEELENQRQTLEVQMEQERESVESMGAEMIGFFGAYSKAVKERIDDIGESLSRLENRIIVAQDDMREAYGELRKIEIVQERREKEQARELAKKESDDLDEIGIQRHSANQD